MKKIIDGTRYDTEKAQLVGEAAAGVSRRDYSFWSAGLYKTPRSGRFFLAGSGGPMTRFAYSPDGNSMSGGEKLIPMTKNEALEWAEQYLSTEIVEHYFSDMIEDA